MFTKSIYDKIGEFGDKKLFYGGDWDFFLRAEEITDKFDYAGAHSAK